MADKSSNVTKAVQTAEAPLVGAPAEYLDGAPREISYVLKVPFRVDGAEYRSLTAHKLVGKDIFAINRKSASQPESDPQLLVFAVMCRVPVRVIEVLDAADVTGLSQATANFMRQLEEAEDGQTSDVGENT